MYEFVSAHFVIFSGFLPESCCDLLARSPPQSKRNQQFQLTFASFACNGLAMARGSSSLSEKKSAKKAHNGPKERLPNEKGSDAIQR
jgi:hypothetical protein